MSDKTSKTRTIKQTKVPEGVIHKIKIQAATEGKALKDVYEEAIYDFFNDRRDHLAVATTHDLYNAPPQNSRILNVELDPKTAKKVDEVAEKDDASGSKVIYTSLIKYARKKHLL